MDQITRTGQSGFSLQCLLDSLLESLDTLFQEGRATVELIVNVDAGAVLETIQAFGTNVLRFFGRLLRYLIWALKKIVSGAWCALEWIYEKIVQLLDNESIWTWVRNIPLLSTVIGGLRCILQACRGNWAEALKSGL